MSTEVGQDRNPYPLNFSTVACLRSHKLRLQVVLQHHLAGWYSSMRKLEALSKMNHPRESWISEGIPKPRRVLCGPSIMEVEAVRVE